MVEEILGHSSMEERVALTHRLVKVRVLLSLPKKEYKMNDNKIDKLYTDEMVSKDFDTIKLLLASDEQGALELFKKTIDHVFVLGISVAAKAHSKKITSVLSKFKS